MWGTGPPYSPTLQETREPGASWVEAVLVRRRKARMLVVEKELDV